MLSPLKRLNATQFALAPIVDDIQCKNDFIGATIMLQTHQEAQCNTNCNGS